MMPVALFLAAALALPPAPAGGTMEVLDARGGLLVAAPHGGFDRFTDEMARRVALLAGGGYLLASGYRTFERPLNVNRPTEGVGLAPAAERRSPAAAAAWKAWAARLDAQHPSLYVEIHGNGRAASAGAIEVATVGVDAEAAAWLEQEFGHRLAYLAPGLPRLPWRLEPLAPIHFRASGAKLDGSLARVPKALHLELPWAVRGDARARGRYADLIAGTLVAFQARSALGYSSSSSRSPGSYTTPWRGFHTPLYVMPTVGVRAVPQVAVEGSTASWRRAWKAARRSGSSYSPRVQ